MQPTVTSDLTTNTTSPSAEGGNKEGDSEEVSVCVSALSPYKDMRLTILTCDVKQDTEHFEMNGEEGNYHPFDDEDEVIGGENGNQDKDSDSDSKTEGVSQKDDDECTLDHKDPGSYRHEGDKWRFSRKHVEREKAKGHPVEFPNLLCVACGEYLDKGRECWMCISAAEGHNNRCCQSFCDGCFFDQDFHGAKKKRRRTKT